MLLLVTWMLSVHAQQPCAKPTTLLDLEREVRRADYALAAGSDRQLTAAAAAAEQALECLSEVATTADAAAYHRVEALTATQQGDEAGAAASLRSVLAIDPDWTPPPELREAFHEARTTPAVAIFDLKPPAEGYLVVDGQRTSAAPSRRPYLLQHVSSAGRVRMTAYIDVGERVPRYPVAEPIAVAEPLAPAPRRRTDSAAIPLVIAGGAGMVAGIALYGDAHRAAREHYPGLVSADQATYWRETLAPRYYAGITLFGLGLASAGGGAVILLTDGAGIGIRGHW